MDQNLIQLFSTKIFPAVRGDDDDDAPPEYGILYENTYTIKIIIM